MPDCGGIFNSFIAGTPWEDMYPFVSKYATLYIGNKYYLHDVLCIVISNANY